MKKDESQNEIIDDEIGTGYDAKKRLKSDRAQCFTFSGIGFGFAGALCAAGIYSILKGNAPAALTSFAGVLLSSAVGSSSLYFGLKANDDLYFLNSKKQNQQQDDEKQDDEIEQQ